MKITFWISLCLMSIPACAQFSSWSDSRDVHFAMGYEQVRLFDQNTSPLVYVANTGSLGFGFERIKPKSNWSAELRLNIGNNQAKRFGQRSVYRPDPYQFDGSRDSTLFEINPGISYGSANLELVYQRKVQKLERELRLGVAIQNAFQYTAMGADTWFLYRLGIKPVLRVNLIQKEDWKLDASGATAILSYLVRQPYAKDPSLQEESSVIAHLKAGRDFTAIHKFQQLDLGLHLRKKLSKDNQLLFAYNFWWMNYGNIPNKPLQVYANSFSVAFIL